MARGNFDKIPNKIYYIIHEWGAKYGIACFKRIQGPYGIKPTQQIQNNHGVSTLIIYKLNNEGNYVKLES